MKQGWEIKKLGEVCKLYQPKTISGEMLEDDGKFLVYGANGVIGRYNQYNHEDSEVLLTCRGATCGSINVSEPYSWINGNAMIVKPMQPDSIVQSFLKYYLTSVDWSEVITGAAQPQITRQSLSPLRIIIPPLAEQEKIVAELDCLSGIIEKKKQQLKEYDALAQSIFYTMFGDPITNEKGWEVKKVKDIFNVKIGPFGSLLHNSDYISGGTPLVNPIHMQDEKICPDFNFSVSGEKLKELDSYLLQPNDIVFARRGDIGRCVIVGKDENGYLCGTGSLFIRPTQPTSPVFMLKSFRCKSMIEHLTSLAKGATMLNINCKIIEELNIIMPPLSLQQEFASKIEAIEKQTEILKQSIEEAETLFNSRMDYYFN